MLDNFILGSLLNALSGYSCVAVIPKENWADSRLLVTLILTELFLSSLLINFTENIYKLILGVQQRVQHPLKIHQNSPKIMTNYGGFGAKIYKKAIDTQR